jgi:hypothetical protein
LYRTRILLGHADEMIKLVLWPLLSTPVGKGLRVATLDTDHDAPEDRDSFGRVPVLFKVNVVGAVG